MKDLKRNIAIVCGGNSSEHEVSLRSARGIYSFFDKEKYNVYIVDIERMNWKVDLGNGEKANIDKNNFSFEHEGKQVFFDYAYLTTSGVLVEALTFNKYVLNNYLRGLGVNVANSILVRRGEEFSINEREVEEKLGMPCFVKPAADGSSFGVSKVKNIDQLAPALRKALMEDESAVIESFLDGTEISVGCYRVKGETRVLPATEVVSHNEFFDYDAKYNGQVEEITPARIANETARRVAEHTAYIYDLLGCNGIIRIDYILTKEADGTDKINLIEVNTTPGMTPTSFIPQQVRAAGLEMKDVLSDIVENQL